MSARTEKSRATIVADASSDIGDLVMKALVICDSMAFAYEVSSTLPQRAFYTNEPLKLSVQFGREQLLAVPIEQVSLSDSNQRASYRCFGINE